MAFIITIDIYELLNNIIFLILTITAKYLLFNSNNDKKDDIIQDTVIEVEGANLDSLSYHKKKINDTLTYTGKSIAAQGTSFYLKEIGVLLDAGQDLGSKTTNVKLILITHKDADHIKCICSHILNSNHNPIILCPNSLSNLLSEMISSFFRTVNNSQYDNWTNHCNIIGMEPNQTYNYVNKKSVIEIKTFKSYHGHTDCLAYGLSNITKGLKEEYKGLQSYEYAKLKKEGVVITEERKKPFLFFATDTTIDIFKNKDIFNYPNIMCECTLLKDVHKLEKRKHIHWNNLQPIIKEYNDNSFILFHFSEQYKEKQIMKFFENINLPNVRPYFI